MRGNAREANTTDAINKVVNAGVINGVEMMAKKTLLGVLHTKITSKMKVDYFNKLKIEAFNSNDAFAFAHWKKEAKKAARGVRRGLGV